MLTILGVIGTDWRERRYLKLGFPQKGRAGQVRPADHEGAMGCGMMGIMKSPDPFLPPA
jgi:hypothetical protein